MGESMEPMQAELQKNMIELAQQAVQIAREDYGAELDFSMDSLAVLYRLLDRAHALTTSPAFEGKTPARTIFFWGAYLGETIRRGSNGEWTENPAATENRRFSINTPTGNIFPMEQVYLRVVEGKKNTNVKAAIVEPPTRRVSSGRYVFLLGILLLVVVIAIIGIKLFL